MSQTLFQFELTVIDARLEIETAKLNAKLAARQQHEAAKREEEMEKSTRRLMREHARKQKQPDQVAVCGINFYTLSPRERARGCYWRHCHKCGKALHYFDTYEEAEAQVGEKVRGRRATRRNS